MLKAKGLKTLILWSVVVTSASTSGDHLHLQPTDTVPESKERLVPVHLKSLAQVAAFSRVSVHGDFKFTGQRKGVGAYMEKPFVRMTYICASHRIIKKGGGRGGLTRRWALTQEKTGYYFAEF